MSDERSSTEYKPGSCNIGQKELSVRKKFLNLFLPLTLLLSFAAFFWDNSLMVWTLLLGSVFCLTVLWFEIKFKFCIIFGFFSLYNFEKLGTIHEVKNRQHPLVTQFRRHTFSFPVWLHGFRSRATEGRHLIPI